MTSYRNFWEKDRKNMRNFKKMQVGVCTENSEKFTGPTVHGILSFLTTFGHSEKKGTTLPAETDCEVLPFCCQGDIIEFSQKFHQIFWLNYRS
jgi:hypothetical protein